MPIRGRKSNLARFHAGKTSRSELPTPAGTRFQAAATPRQQGWRGQRRMDPRQRRCRSPRQPAPQGDQQQKGGPAGGAEQRSNKPQLAPSAFPTESRRPRVPLPVTARKAGTLGLSPAHEVPMPEGLLSVTPLQAEALVGGNTRHSSGVPCNSAGGSCPTERLHKAEREGRRRGKEDPTGTRSPPPRSCPWWPLGPPEGAQRRAPAVHHVPLPPGPAWLGSAPPSRLSRRAAPSRPSAGTGPQPLSARSLRAGPGSA